MGIFIYMKMTESTQKYIRSTIYLWFNLGKKSRFKMATNNLCRHYCRGSGFKSHDLYIWPTHGTHRESMKVTQVVKNIHPSKIWRVDESGPCVTVVTVLFWLRLK